MGKEKQRKILIAILQSLVVIIWLIIIGLHFFVPIFPLLFFADVFFFGGHSLYRWLFYRQEMWKNSLLLNNDYIKYHLMYSLIVGCCVVIYYWQASWKIVTLFIEAFGK